MNDIMELATYARLAQVLHITGGMNATTNTRSKAMKTYRIENEHSGLILGEYEGESEADALDAMARDAGYQSYRGLCHVNRADEDDSGIVCTELD
jgi:hypothetical protein